VAVTGRKERNSLTKLQIQLNIAFKHSGILLKNNNNKKLMYNVSVYTNILSSTTFSTLTIIIITLSF